jgi:uncharacterized membrane protein YhfC
VDNAENSYSRSLTNAKKIRCTCRKYGKDNEMDIPYLHTVLGLFGSVAPHHDSKGASGFDLDSHKKICPREAILDTMAVFDILIRAFCCALMLAIPLGLFAYLRKESGATWRWIGIGAATFVASQVVHIPLNGFVLMPLMKVLGMGDMKEPKGIELFILALILGLSAGVCEEVSRYLVYRYWLAGNTYVDRSWKAAVSLGAGHGGCEAIILSILLILALFEMIELRHADLSKLLPPDKAQEVQEELVAYWSMPWYEVFMPAVERVSALTFQVSASVLVLQVFQRGNIWWLGAAIAFHATIDAIAVVTSVQKWNVLMTEALLAVLIIPLALKIIFYFRDARSVDQEETLQPLLAADQDEEAASRR